MEDLKGQFVSFKYRDRKDLLSGFLIDNNNNWALLKYNPVDYVIDGYNAFEKSTMKKHLLSLVIFLALSTNSFSSEEGYFGKYFSINDGIKVEFTLTENGISDLIVDSIEVDTGSLKYDYLARYGSSQVFQIRFDDNTKCNNEIKLFIVENDGEFVITAGYYIQYKMKDDKLIVLRKQALELARENDPD